ncbi:hypothetical protein RSAG8_03523, partial [Rhizoctonia solani AG-8 WAC10335]
MNIIWLRSAPAHAARKIQVRWVVLPILETICSDADLLTCTTRLPTPKARLVTSRPASSTSPTQSSRSHDHDRRRMKTFQKRTREKSSLRDGWYYCPNRLAGPFSLVPITPLY